MSGSAAGTGRTDGSEGRPATAQTSPLGGGEYGTLLVRPMWYFGVRAGDLAGVGEARRYVGRKLRGWGLDGMAGDVLLCVSELAANAVEHARPDARRTWDVRVGVRRYAGWLYLEVSDGDPAPPRLSAAAGGEDRGDGDGTEGRGRGLLLVQALADAVWWEPVDCELWPGKAVRARFPLPRGES